MEWDYDPNPKDPALTEESLEASMPHAVGYKILIALPQVADTYESGIAKAYKEKHIEEVYSVVGRVLDMGPDAYKDTSKFPTGPWCKIGDWVVFRALTGSRYKVYDQEVRMINDDSVDGVVDDPKGLTRAY